MSKSRQELISKYDIPEPGLRKLIDDLCQQKETKENILLIQNALEGRYAEYGSQVTPNAILIIDLQHACFSTVNGDYVELIKKAKEYKYSHNYTLTSSPSHQRYIQSTFDRPQTHYIGWNNSFNFVNEWNAGKSNDCQKSKVEEVSNLIKPGS